MNNKCGDCGNSLKDRPVVESLEATVKKGIVIVKVLAVNICLNCAMEAFDVKSNRQPWLTVL